MTNNNRRPYEKLINQLQKKRYELEMEINSLPDINLFTFPYVLVKTFLNPARIQELEDELNRLRSQARSAIDTYARGVQGEDQQRQVIQTNNFEMEPSYFSQFNRLIEDIAILEARLHHKNFKQFLYAETDKEPEAKAENFSQTDQRTRTRREVKKDWKEFDLKGSND